MVPGPSIEHADVAQQLALRDGRYAPVRRSGLIEFGPAELAEQIDWP